MSEQARLWAAVVLVYFLPTIAALALACFCTLALVAAVLWRCVR